MFPTTNADSLFSDFCKYIQKNVYSGKFREYTFFMRYYLNTAVGNEVFSIYYMDIVIILKSNIKKSTVRNEVSDSAPRLPCSRAAGCPTAVYMEESIANFNDIALVAL